MADNLSIGQSDASCKLIQKIQSYLWQEVCCINSAQSEEQFWNMANNLLAYQMGTADDLKNNPELDFMLMSLL